MSKRRRTKPKRPHSFYMQTETFDAIAAQAIIEGRPRGRLIQDALRLYLLMRVLHGQPVAMDALDGIEGDSIQLAINK